MIRNQNRPSAFQLRQETAGWYANKIDFLYGNDPASYGDRVLALVNGDRRMEHLTLRLLGSETPHQPKRKRRRVSWANLPTQMVYRQTRYADAA